MAPQYVPEQGLVGKSVTDTAAFLAAA